jgi:hypothetical protein
MRAALAGTGERGGCQTCSKTRRRALENVKGLVGWLVGWLIDWVAARAKDSSYQFMYCRYRYMQDTVHAIKRVS